MPAERPDHLDERSDVMPAEAHGRAAVEEGTEELPVVARLVVEIRSDGTRTIARGAIEDLELDHRAGVEIRSATPAQLVRSLVRALFQLPAIGRDAAHGFWPRRLRGRREH